MRLIFCMLPAVVALGQTRTVSLKEAVEQALRLNPEIVLAKLEEQKAREQIRIARDPFVPKVFAGSGVAYSYGFPMSIEGSAPSIVQVRGVASVFNKPQSARIAQAREAAQSTAIDTDAKREDVAMETATVFLEAVRWARTAEAIRGQIDAMQRAAETVEARVKEGRELEIEWRRATLGVAKTRHRHALIEEQREYAEGLLSAAIGVEAPGRVRPVETGALGVELPGSEEAVLRMALGASKELRKLESSVLVKQMALREHESARLPTLDLVAQYGLFAKFNNYEDFFRRFQRHNGQLGVSVQVPLFRSGASEAQASQARTDLDALRTRMGQVRGRIAVTVRNAWRQTKLSEEGRQIARADLELAREQVTVLLAQWEEGRVSQRQLEEARFTEQEKWIGYHEAQMVGERAKLALAKVAGSLLTALQ
ncbi:MAG: TolC family protein [Bryobacterales bacterium]|nr:TolC family protein [Bryobacterales bacterium]